MRTFFAPGRVNLIGEYTDLVGGLVLPCALDLGVTLSGDRAARVRLRSRGYGAPSPTAGWGRYVEGVVAELAALGRPAVGFDGSLTSTLPSGAGLSSSAALEVVLALALCAVADFPLAPLELAQAAQRAEHRAVGVPSGIMDQTASLLGRAGHALLLDTRTLAFEYVAIPSDLALVVVDSGTKRALEGTGYATRKRELEEGHPRRRRHVESENERVLSVVEAFRTDDRVALGELFRAGHQSLRDDLEVTTPDLDRLVDLAYDAGAVAARMTGGGFGGAIVALAETSRAQELADAVVAAYGPRGRSWVSRASDGAREIEPFPAESEGVRFRA